jgi:hypothetical protein
MMLLAAVCLARGFQGAGGGQQASHIGTYFTLVIVANTISKVSFTLHMSTCTRIMFSWCSLLGMYSYGLPPPVCSVICAQYIQMASVCSIVAWCKMFAVYLYGAVCAQCIQVVQSRPCRNIVYTAQNIHLGHFVLQYIHLMQSVCCPFAWCLPGAVCAQCIHMMQCKFAACMLCAVLFVCCSLDSDIWCCHCAHSTFQLTQYVCSCIHMVHTVCNNCI